MLAIETKTAIQLVVRIKLYQARDQYLIQFNDEEIFKYYSNKNDAMTDFIKLSSFLKKKELKIEKVGV